MTRTSNPDVADVVLIGAGIMGATLGTVIKELEPSFNVVMFETLEDCAQESSDGWNNAGTGHAANCEMNYTPQRSDGSVDITKALEVNVEFDLSRQLWTYLVRGGGLGAPDKFIHACPHMSFVFEPGEVGFLRARFKAMSAHPCYHGMEYTEDRKQIETWAPLVMEGRNQSDAVAATRIVSGSDVDYGALTHLLVTRLSALKGFSLHYNSQVVGLSRDGKLWRIDIEDLKSGETRTTLAQFVFIGAGGASIELLQKSNIPEGHGYGGFPVSGIWLRCDDPTISARHHANVYGKAAHGSPPMSVPHLDTRIINGKRSLLFGPYAGFSSKFLKYGSHADLFKSLRPGNIEPLLAVAKDNWPLCEYLIGQVFQTKHHMFAVLQQFFPNARRQDWREAVAGQRVQIIKPDKDHVGELEFGTELVVAADRSLVALLGASPGASTAAFVALEVLRKCFAEHLTNDEWLPKLKSIIPTYGIDLRTDAAAVRRNRADTAAALDLEYV